MEKIGRGPAEFDKVLALLESIRSTEKGNIIFEHVLDMLKEIDSRGSDIDQIYAEMLGTLLNALASQFGSDEHIAVQLKMLQLRFAPPTSKSELLTLKRYVDLVASSVEDSSQVEGFSRVEDSSRVEDFSRVEDSNSIEDFAYAEIIKRRPKKSSENFISQFDAMFQRHINQKNKEISEIRNTLARHVGEVIAHNDQFGVLLSVELEALKGTVSIKDVDDRRAILVDEVSLFIENHAKLSEKFDNASKYLTMIESDNQQFSDELDRVRLWSLTDELTTLSNRRAFMQRLEDEVGRVGRYGYPITLMLMDLDKFKDIDDKYGHVGGDAVLKSYVEEVLTIFRHHDMIARYGGEKFAVILPNTGEKGALSALRKVQDGVAQIFCVVDDETIPMPTFSAGLAQYVEGETPAEFIERANHALSRAKEQGRNRIHVADDVKFKDGDLGSDATAENG